MIDFFCKSMAASNFCDNRKSPLITCNLNHCPALYRFSNKSYDENKTNLGENPLVKWRTLSFFLLLLRFLSVFLETSKALWLAKIVKVVVSLQWSAHQEGNGGKTDEKGFGTELATSRI